MRRMEPCHKNDRVGGRNVCRAMDYSNGKEILAWIEDDRLAVPTGNSIASTALHK